MKVSVRGENKKISKKEMRYVIKFYAVLLLKEKFLQDLEIDIVNDPSVKVCGEVYTINTDSRRRPTDFEIVLNPTMSKKRMLMTLAHEMIHVKQYITGQLKHLERRGVTRWEGQIFKEDTRYFDQPWEIDAFGREPGLYTYYREHVRKNKLTF